MARTPELVPVRGIENVSQQFKERVIQIASDLNINPNHLMAVISFETDGTFSPSIKNMAGSGATGLIQFTPKTAKGLGTSVEELAKMSAEEQLDFVAQHIEPYKERLNTLDDVYMAVLYPEAIGKDKDHLLFQQGTDKYEQNEGLDRNRDGIITVGEATQRIQETLQQGLARQSNGTRSQPSASLVQQFSNTDNQPVFAGNVPEKQLSKPTHQSFQSMVAGSGKITSGFMEPYKHGRKNFTTQFISGKKPNQVQTIGPGNYNIGIDYTVDDWKVRALYSGTVTSAGYEGGYGNRIHVKTDLTFEFQGQEYPVHAAYAHLDSMNVQKGQRLEQGDKIGIMGNTGASNGAHVDLATWIEVDGKTIYVSPNLLDEQLNRQQSGINPTLKATAVADAARIILNSRGQSTEGGQIFQGNTYSISDRNGVLSVTKGEAEILRVENGNISGNKVSDTDLMGLSRVAYEMNYGEYPRVSTPADVTLTAMTLANAAKTVAMQDPRNISAADGAFFLEGDNYNIWYQGDDLRLEAKDGRGTILEVQDGQIQVNQATVGDVAILSSTGFEHSQQAQPTFLPILGLGDRGTEVSLLQTRLSELGYLEGDIDGIFGPQTEAAVERFQEENGLDVDGIVGPNTWQSLDAEPQLNQIWDVGDLQLVSHTSLEERAVPQNAYARLADYVQETLERPDLEGIELDVYMAEASLDAGVSIQTIAQILSQGPQAQALHQQDPAEARSYVHSCLEQASQQVQQSSEPQARQPEMVLG